MSKFEKVIKKKSEKMADNVIEMKASIVVSRWSWKDSHQKAVQWDPFAERQKIIYLGFPRPRKAPVNVLEREFIVAMFPHDEIKQNEYLHLCYYRLFSPFNKNWLVE